MFHKHIIIQNNKFVNENIDKGAPRLGAPYLVIIRTIIGIDACQYIKQPFWRKQKDNPNNRNYCYPDTAIGEMGSNTAEVINNCTMTNV